MNALARKSNILSGGAMESDLVFKNILNVKLPLIQLEINVFFLVIPRK